MVRSCKKIESRLVIETIKSRLLASIDNVAISKSLDMLNVNSSPYHNNRNEIESDLDYDADDL